MSGIEQDECTIADISVISRCMGPSVHLDDVDIPALWRIARDGVDNFMPDMIDMAGIATSDGDVPVLYGVRRLFEINRRVVNALNALVYAYGDEGDWVMDPPVSLTVGDYDDWVGSHDTLIAQYQAMGYSFIAGKMRGTFPVWQGIGGCMTTQVDGVEYNLVEKGQ